MADDKPKKSKQPPKKETKKKDAEKGKEQEPVIRQSHLFEMVIIKKPKDDD